MISDDQSREPRDEPVLGPRIDPEPEAGPEDRSDTLAFEPVQRRRPKRRIGRTLIILVLLVGAGAGAWARWGGQLRPAPGDEIPVVRADAAPVKVKPDRPGGLDIPNRDKLVYDRLESLPPPPRAENLLPRPEAPLPPPSARPTAPPGAPAGRPAGAAPMKTAEAKTAEAKTPEPPKPLMPLKPIAAHNVPKIERPKPVKAAVVKKPLPPPAPPAMKAKPKAAAAAPAKPVASAPKSVPPAPPAMKTKPKAAAAKPAKPAASAPKSAAPAAEPAGNGYRVQLAAVRSNKDARREWTRLRTRHSDLLGRLRHSVVRADLGAKGIYYRLRAGPLENKAAARTLCGELTKIKVGCLVVRPGR